MWSGIVDPGAYNEVSVSFRNNNLAKPVIFACGALPAKASLDRMETDVGLRLTATVRTWNH
jgi:hypothetical protein